MAESEFLLEVRCEEIPARMLVDGVRQLATRFFDELVGRGLVPEEVETGFSPRRLLLRLGGVAAREPDRQEQVVGPPAAVAWRDGRPTAALAGFAARCGVEVEAVGRTRTAKGEYAVVDQAIEGRATRELLAELTPRLLAEIRWAKEMRWAHSTGPWVRPVQGLLALYAGELVPCSFFGVDAEAWSRGHALHSPEPWPVRDAAEYEERLNALGVEIRFERRRARLLERAHTLAAEAGGRLVEDAALLDRLAAVCEIPGIVRGHFDAGFLELPREVLTASLRDHQSAFTVEGEDGLLPCFLTVMDRADDPEGLVTSGNEWVVAARLADARFFWQEDLRRPLAERRENLGQLTFQERLGSYADKAERLERLMAWLCESANRAELVAAGRRAATLAKVDLTTEMVKEFTELQGVMGGIYARTAGEEAAVWQAIADQYLPASGDDPLPRGDLGRLLALADRVDTLTGMFGIGLVPTGSRDPLGLRRAAQGVIRILLEGIPAVSLRALLLQGGAGYGDRLDSGGEELLERLRPFLADRVRHVLGLEGHAHDEIEAAMAADWDDLPDLRRRVAALREARQLEGFPAVVAAAKRIANILRDRPVEDLQSAPVDEADRRLEAAVIELEARIGAPETARDPAQGLAAIARIAPELDHFFEAVLVLSEVPEERALRLALLRRVQEAMAGIARLQELSVERVREEGDR